LLLLGSTALLLSQDAATQTPPDNTKTNQQDRNANSPTADRQGNAKSDIDITKQIRHAIADDKALSTYAHNVKVVTREGQVILRGPVRSADEKRAIEAKAGEIAGESNVASQLTVKPND
jgi:osmotically-inducible protein OsmY